MNFKPRNEGYRNLLKLKPGESVKGVFRGNPFDFRQHWHNNRSFICSGVECSYCKDGSKSSFRFRINFLISENGTYLAKVFEQGGKTYDALRSLHESDYDLERAIVKVTRNGNGTDTTYSIVPVPRGEVSEELEKKLSEIPLNDLTHLQSAHESPESDEDMPF